MKENKFFPEVKGNFGFGCMRLPMQGDKVDIDETCRMVDAFIAAGFNYFDTAHGYIGGQSETALKAALTSRYPRDKYLLADKLSHNFFEKEEDIRPYFNTMLEAAGVEYFDFFLMHAQGSGNYQKYKDCRAYEIAQELKAEGKIRHVGFSFHDSAEVLDMILTEHPEVEFVQLQFNYLDYEDEGVQSRKCYETCVKHGKPVVVMEPVRGGSLVNLPADALKVMADLNGCSAAGYAVRFAGSFDNNHMVLSGMSNMEQMTDNLSSMTDFKPLDETEQAALREVVRIFRAIPQIGCTGCRYCCDGCPMHINIPAFFAAQNRARRFGAGQAMWLWNRAVKDGGKPSDCIGCGQCEDICPQHLPVRELLEEVAATFEK